MNRVRRKMLTHLLCTVYTFKWIACTKFTFFGLMTPYGRLYVRESCCYCCHRRCVRVVVHWCVNACLTSTTSPLLALAALTHTLSPAEPCASSCLQNLKSHRLVVFLVFFAHFFTRKPHNDKPKNWNFAKANLLSSLLLYSNSFEWIPHLDYKPI